MSEKQRKRVSGVEIFGLVVCIGGALIAAVVTLSIFREEVEAPGQSALLAQDVISFLGTVPALLLSIACAVLGARAFLSGRSVGFMTNLSGVVGTSIGLAVLLGAFSETAGGAVGAYSGGLVARYLTVVPGAIFGLVVLAIPIWLTWLRDLDLLFREKRKTRPSAAALIDEPITDGVSREEADALLPAGGDAEETPGSALPVLDDALPNTDGALQTPDWALKNSTTKPYPEDVRLKGEIPPGAAPLTTSDDETETSPPLSDPTVQRWTPGSAEGPADSPDGDLVVGGEQEEGQRQETRPVESDGPGELSRPGERSSLTGETAARAEEREDEETATAEVPAEEVESDQEANPDLTRVLLGGTKSAAPELDTAVAEKSGLKVIRPEVTPPRPLWEHEEAPEAEAVAKAEHEAPGDSTKVLESTPVAEEGTDLDVATVVATETKLEATEEEAALEPTEVDAPDPTLASEVEPEEEEEEDDEALLEAEAELEEDEEEEEEEDEEDEDDEILQAAEGELDDDEEEEDDEEEQDDDDEYEYVEVDEEEEVEDEAGVQAPSASAEEGEEDDDELGEDEEWEYEYVEVDEYEEEPDSDEESDEEEDESEEAPTAHEVSAEEESVSEEEPEPLEVRAEEEPIPAEEEPPPLEVEAEAEPVAAGEAVSEEPAPEEAAPEEEILELTPVAATDASTGEVQMDLFEEPVDAASPSEATEEPTVVLQPTPRPPIEASPRALVVAEMILEQERVAVSMVQRRFGIDFAESCSILDELQDAGFIGPYVDGKSRDILMTREEWLAAVTPS